MNMLLNKVTTNLSFLFQWIKKSYYLILLSCCVCLVFLIDVKLNGTIRFINYNTTTTSSNCNIPIAIHVTTNNNYTSDNNNNPNCKNITIAVNVTTINDDGPVNGIHYDDVIIIDSHNNDSILNGNNNTIVNFTTDTNRVVETTVEVMDNDHLANNNTMPIENLKVVNESLQDDVVDKKILSMKKDQSNEIHNNLFVNFTTNTNRVAIETVEVMFQDLKYRRVCTSVGRYSTLCIIIRYPFPVPLQINDITIRYPKPVDERFYDLDHDNVYTIKRNGWLTTCSTNVKNNNKNNHMIIMDDDNNNIKKCMEQYAVLLSSKRKDHKVPVISMWTRRTTKNNSDGVTLFHDTDYDEALDRVYRFFGQDHEVIVVGASPAPNVTTGLKSIFGSNNCNITNVRPEYEWYPNYNCDNNYHRNITWSAKHINDQNNIMKMMNNKSPYVKLRKQNKFVNFTYLEENHINLCKVDYRLTGDKDDYRLLTGQTVLDNLKPLRRKSGWISLRNLSLIIEYPFAHVQRQEMLLNEKLLQRVQLHQNILPEYFVNVSSPSSRSLLSELGYKFQHMFAFDGIPQFWPTATSGFAGPLLLTSDIRKNKNNKNSKLLLEYFTNNVTGWKPDYGTSCRGPLPSNSLLRDINLLSRNQFETLGFNMAWYGRTWEFANLYWFQMKKWAYSRHIPGKRSGFGLDCTHPQGLHGLNSIHGYFVQAMIDDYFD